MDKDIKLIKHAQQFYDKKSKNSCFSVQYNFRVFHCIHKKKETSLKA